VNTVIKSGTLVSGIGTSPVINLNLGNSTGTLKAGGYTINLGTTGGIIGSDSNSLPTESRVITLIG
jgi:hypothetical protein